VNRGVDSEPLSIVYKRRPKPYKDALSRPEEHTHNIPKLEISPIMCSSVEPSKINKGNIFSHWA
jgi:hypothetical protein